MKKTKNIALIGVLGALSAMVMMFEIPFPLAPWLKFDLSDIITLFGGLVGGPLVATAIALVKIVLNTLIKGSTTSGIGESVNIIATLIFVLPTIFVYEKTKKISLGLLVGTVAMTILLVIGNYYYITPFYAKLYKMDFILDMMKKNDGSYGKYIAYYYGFFNGFKGIVQSIIYLIVHGKLKKKYRTYTGE